MADVKHTLSLGIGFSPGSLKFTTTSGLGIAESVSPLVKGAALGIYADDLRVVSLNRLGSVPGVSIIEVAALNGIGTAAIRTTGDGTLLAWRAPGSSTYGKAVDVSAGGEFLLLDGIDDDRWAWVRVSPAFLSPTGTESRVLIQDAYLTGVPGYDDGQSAGGTLTTELELRNESQVDIVSPRFWIDPARAAYLSISADGLLYSSPTTEGGALPIAPSIPADGTATVYVRRTIPPAESHDPRIAGGLKFAYEWEGTTHYADGRGLWRIFADAEYRLFRRLNEPPEITDVPFDTTPAPLAGYESTVPFGDGLWFVSVEYFNGVLGSGFRPLGPNGETYVILEVLGGQEQLEAPAPPAEGTVTADRAGNVRVQGKYYELGANRATEWSIGWRIGGGDPAINQTDAAFPIATAGADVLDELSLTSIPAGQVVSVRIQTRRADGQGGFVYSRESILQEVTMPAPLEAPPQDPHRWIGAPPKQQ